MRGLYQKVTSGVYPELSSKYSDDLKHVVKMCLEINPSIRPTAAQMLRKKEIVLRLRRYD